MVRKYSQKLDAASGFHQIPLDEESRLLTGFITPFGRFSFKRLPFGISSAPENFQRKMTELLGDIEGVQVIIDDILVHGKTMEKHNKRQEETLELIEESGIKLNPGKYEFRKSTIRYFGHVISDKGIQPSKDKIKVILKLPPSSAILELKIFLGMTQYLGKYMPKFSSTTANVRTFEKGIQFGSGMNHKERHSRESNNC